MFKNFRFLQVVSFNKRKSIVGNNGPNFIVYGNKRCLVLKYQFAKHAIGHC